MARPRRNGRRRSRLMRCLDTTAATPRPDASGTQPRRRLSAMKARTASRPRALSTCRASTPPRRRGADAHPHLAAEPLGEVAVAVDDDRRPCFDGLARQMAVEVEVSGRAVHLDGRAGVARRREEAIPLEVVAVGASGRPVGRVGDDADQRMRHRPQVARQQAIGRLAGGIVQRGEDDVEAGHDRDPADRGCRPAGCRPRSRAGSSAPGRPARSASISFACWAMPSIDSVRLAFDVGE